eukprot:TRINITY_DN10993_c0_g1_i1.p1 TRINITY_DN10993_c0_g1~~TRINITY_DN10993_c0_g1_i1.p1  ORF type:complete len:1603 (+),score=563.58 TRINITY_DN10993_c0_g1_i1:679-4809(+)
MSRPDARAICLKLKDTSVAKACLLKFPTMDVDAYVEDCTEDVIETSDPTFLEIAVSGLEDECADLGNRDLETWEEDADGNVVEPSNDLQNVICPTSNDKPCSGNGICNKTKCTCNAGFKGIDCGIDTTAPPVLENLGRPFCDGRGLKGCDPHVSVFGSNFFRQEGKTVKCKFGNLNPTDGMILGSIELLCPLPTTRFTGQSAIAQNLTVSFDSGVTYTAPQAGLHYTWYDSVCEICNSTGCVPNPSSCNIDGKCYIATQFNTDNQCLQCQPATSTSAWTYSYVHAAACGPKFDAVYYEATIVARANKGERIFTMDATNDLTKDDPTTSITYSLANPDRHPQFTIDATTGVVTTTQDIVVTEALQFRWRGTMLIRASDGRGNVAETNLHVDVLETNSDPIFTAKSVNVTLKEDDAVGSRVASLEASDSGFQANLTYAWLQLQAGHHDTFALNNATGEVTLAKPLDFETQSEYTMQISATDNGGQWASAYLYVRVENVNEPPTAINLNSTSFEENNAAAVVGTLTAEDEDFGDSHTFTIEGSAPFAIDGDVLKTTQAFDFETTKMAAVTVIATDAGGMSTRKNFDLTITNVNEAPNSISLAGLKFAEDAALVGGELTIVSATDPDENDVVLCTLRDDDAGHFVIEDMRLIVLKALDFETKTSHTIEVLCEDISGLGIAREFTLTIDNADEPPSAVTLSVAGPISEDAAIGTTIGTLSAVDEDANAGTIAFAVIAPAQETKYFRIGNVTCGATLPKTCTAPVIVDAALDYDINGGKAPLRVRAVDNLGYSSITELEVELANVNEPANGVAWVNGAPSISETAPAGTLVGQLMVDDQDQGSEYTFTLLDAETSPFELVSPTAARRRSVTGSVVNVRVRSSSSLDAQLSPALTLRLQVQDGSLTNTFTASVTITDAPLQLTFADGSTEVDVNETSPNGTVISTLIVNNLNADESVTGFEIVSGVGHVHDVKIVGNELQVAKPMDYEQMDGIAINVRALISGGRGDITQPLSVDIQNVDEHPVFIHADGSSGPPTAISLPGNAASGTKLGSLIARDPEGERVSVVMVGQLSDALSVQVDNLVSPVGGYTIYLNGNVKPGKYNIAVTATTPQGQASQHKMVLSVAPGNPSVINTNSDASSGSSSDSDSGATIGIVVGVLVAIVLVAVIAFFVLRSRKPRGATPLPTADFKAEQSFDNPTFVAPSQDFVAGVNNPMYEWYAPELSRTDATNELAHCAPGAFVVRDSQATPGWHILGVKTSDAVLHEKIRLDEEGLYELIPSNQQPQPAFHSLPDLVHYYGQQREDMQYALDFSSFDNPLYAAFQEQQHQQHQGNYAAAGQWRRDADAPVVPLKARDLDTVAQLTQQDDIYTNAAEASAALSTSA